MKIKVTQEVEVPAGLILYDVADETIQCTGCRTAQPWELDGDRITSSRPALDKFFAMFAEQHVKCIGIGKSPRKIVYGHTGFGEATGGIT